MSRTPSCLLLLLHGDSISKLVDFGDHTLKLGLTYASELFPVVITSLLLSTVIFVLLTFSACSLLVHVHARHHSEQPPSWFLIHRWEQSFGCGRDRKQIYLRPWLNHRLLLETDAVKRRVTGSVTSGRNYLSAVFIFWIDRFHYVTQLSVFLTSGGILTP